MAVSNDGAAVFRFTKTRSTTHLKYRLKLNIYLPVEVSDTTMTKEDISLVPKKFWSVKLNVMLT